MRSLIACLLVPLAVLQGGEAKPDRHAEHARFAPPVNAKLLFFSLAGGAGDQWFNAVQVKGRKVVGMMEKGPFGLTVTVKDDDSVSARMLGEKSATTKPDIDLPNGGKTGPYTWGYKQVDPNLQQPFLTGGGLNLWGWTLEQAKTAKVRYAPAMADSRIKGLWITPKGTLLATSFTDGGNTILRADPRDRNVTMETGFDAGGGGGGRSSWLIELSAKNGAPLGVLACRGSVVCHAYDAWNRLIVGGGAVNRTGADDVTGNYDGAGLLMADYDWKNALFRAHLGLPKDAPGKAGGMTWAIDVDSDSGVMAAVGWMEGTPRGVHAIQEKSGGGKDAFLAVFRLWTENEAAAAKQAETDAKRPPAPSMK